MATTVGTETSFEKLVTDLIYLERDAIAAYEASIERLSDPACRDEMAGFKNDHVQHLQVLTEIAREAGADAPAEGDMKEMLTTGKVALAGIMGDGAILKAMKTNEDDTVTAYERAVRHDEALAKSKAFFEKALVDETRHRDWMDRTARSL